MRSLRSIAIVVLIFLGTLFPALATTSLSFVGGGYWIDLEIGSEGPVVSSVRFHRPGEPKGVMLVRRDVAVETFDPRHHVLVMRFRGSQGQNAVDPFTLSVHGQHAVLKIGGRDIASKYSWEM